MNSVSKVSNLLSDSATSEDMYRTECGVTMGATFFSFSTKALETGGNPRAAFQGVHVSYVVPDTREINIFLRLIVGGARRMDFPPRPPRSPYLFRSH